MFTVQSGVKRIFYSQTGNFQFNCNLSVDNYTGIANFGISGSGLNNINFLLSGGKIIDTLGRFLQTYPLNTQFNISGNVNNSSYDLFYNGFPISYHNTKSTGVYNYFYLNPRNLNLSYNLYINGNTPSLTISDINCSINNSITTGFIVNNDLSLRIYSGQFNNFNSLNSNFALSGFFTGDLGHNQTGKFYLLPNGSGSIGSYIASVQLQTSAGDLFYNINVNITGNTNSVNNTLILNGLNTIGANSSQLYTANVISTLPSGFPFSVSLSYVSGSGNYYNWIDISSGWQGNISGLVIGNSIISQFVSGIGSGQGGQLNNIATGFASGIITGINQYATGVFIWNYPILISGYATGVRYSGIGTGLYSVFNGIILDGSGTYDFSGLITGSTGQLKSIGPTGYKHGTGKIFYNSPVSFDKIYVNDPNVAIVNNYSYINITGLTSYLNSHTGIHLVTAIDDGINTITLSGLFGAFSNVGLSLDNTNIGNMSISSASLIGGLDLGIGNSLVGSTYTGFLINTFTGSGCYTQLASGDIFGSGSVLDYIKTFTGSWDLSTGTNPFDILSYKNNNFLINNNSIYQNNYPTNYINSTSYINIQYTNNNDFIQDVALLTITGSGLNTGLSMLITGG
jgi:hypothetical protein